MLSPRSDIGVYSSNKNRKKKNKETEKEKDKENNNGLDLKVEEHRDPAAMVGVRVL